MYGTRRISHFGMHQLSSYERMQYQRQRRAEGAELAQKHARLASSFATIQNNKAVEMGNLFSRIAMQRISTNRLSKLA
mgnify:CR=1 FL=1